MREIEKGNHELKEINIFKHLEVGKQPKVYRLAVLNGISF